jgi:hypothetical protein
VELDELHHSILPDSGTSGELMLRDDSRDESSEFDNSMFELPMLESASCVLQHLGNSARDSKQAGGVMDQQQKFNHSKLGWTVDELARSLSVSVPFSSA